MQNCAEAEEGRLLCLLLLRHCKVSSCPGGSKVLLASCICSASAQPQEGDQDQDEEKLFHVQGIERFCPPLTKATAFRSRTDAIFSMGHKLSGDFVDGPDPDVTVEHFGSL